MGAGEFPAGEGPAGLDPPAPALADSTTKRVPYFDPFTKSFPLELNGSGEFQAVHPVDQAVALALGIQLNGVAAQPGRGLDIQRLRRASRATVALTVADVVRIALADLVAAGDITLNGTPLMADANGRPWYFVDYTNLRLPAQPRRQMPVPR